MFGKTKTDWEATRAILTGDFELVFTEEDNGIYVHYKKNSAHILNRLEDYPEIVNNASVDNYQPFSEDARAYFPDISLTELLEKLGIDELEVQEIID